MTDSTETTDWMAGIRKSLMPALTAMKADDNMRAALDSCLADWHARCREAGIEDNEASRAAVVTAIMPIVSDTGIDPYTIPDALATLMLALVNNANSEDEPARTPYHRSPRKTDVYAMHAQFDR